MFPENPFLQLTLPRVNKALQRIKMMIWKEVAPVTCAFGGHQKERIPFELACNAKFKPVSLPFKWGKLFDQGWFRLEIPQVKVKGPLYLHWNDQGEGTAYLQGVPYYGFDVAHRHCALPPKTREVFIESLCLQSAIWHPAATGLDPMGSCLSHAALFTRDDLAWEVWHDLRVLFEMAVEEEKAAHPTQPVSIGGVGYRHPMEVVSPFHRRLVRSLENAVNALDRDGLSGMKTVLKKAYAEFSGQHARIKSVLTGHAHIDLVWLWPESSAEYKAVHTFSTMNRLMDVYPDLIFGYSQPASYDAVGKFSPALMKQVSQRIQSGRWEALGATEVESDTLMACGEALSRSFLLGQKGFCRLQGKPSRVLWIPDVFGYCGSLPQIMRQTDVEFFFTTKLTWSNINLFPYSSFIWRGIDGSEVVVHVTQDNGYNQVVSPEEIRRGAKAYRQSDIHDEFLSPTGYGDGGGGVTEEMCERAKRLASIAGMPEVAWGRVDDFFDRLNSVRDKLPAWQGELYLEYHRGVLTTHGDLKWAFRACERALQTWEAARCALGAGVLEDQPWRRLVFAQFHDYIPGSSIWEVYEEGLPELAQITKDAVENAAQELSNQNAQPAIFNPLPVDQIVLLEDSKKAVKIPALTGAVISDLPELEADEPVKATKTSLSSGQVRADFDAKGRIQSLMLGGCEIAVNGLLADLVLYPEFPHEFDAWEIDRAALALGKSEESAAKVTVFGGGLRGGVQFHRKLGKKSSVIVRYELDAFEPVLRIDYEIDWQDEQTLLKVEFPTAYSGSMARFGSPFGSVLRGQHAGPSRDEAMFESAGSRWAVVSDDGESSGLAVITEAKYGFSCRDGQLGVSLIRSPRVTGEDLGHSRLLPPALRRGGERPTFSDIGKHRIRIALSAVHPGQTRDLMPAALADRLFTSTLPYTGKSVSSGLVAVEGLESLIPCWAKPAEDGRGWILRLHETMGRRGTGILRLEEGWKAFQTDLSEKPGPKKALTHFDVAPYALLSFRVCK